MADWFEESSQSAGTPVLIFTGPPERPKLQQTLEEALHNPVYPDITLVARGGSLKAHRIILVSQLTKLTGQLNIDTEEIALNVDVNILKMLLSYIYVNRVEIPEAHLQELEEAANSLGIEELKIKCIKAQLSKETTVGNCLEMWIKAFSIQDEDAMDSTRDFALQHFVKLHKSSAFRALPYTLLKEYILHPDLSARSQEERLGAVLIWVRADSKARAARLPTFLDALPLSQMSQWFLDHLLADSLVEGLPQACITISHALQEITGRDRQKSDLSKREKCLIFTGARIQGQCNTEIKAIRLQHNFKIISFGEFKTQCCDNITNCLMVGDVLYICVIGEKMGEVWSFNMQEASSQFITRLNTPRNSHTMFSGPEGLLFIIGGYSSVDGQSHSSVEVINVNTGTCTEAGHLRHKDSFRLACCQVQDGDKVAVCGARDDQGYHTIQTYDTKMLTTTQSIQLPDNSLSCVYGVVEVKGHLIVVAGCYTAVVSVDDVIHGCSTSLTLSKRYITPLGCNPAVVLTEGNTNLLLLGGSSCKHKQHFTYSAKVYDIMMNTKSGWQPLKCPWKLGSCKLYGGYDTGDIEIPWSKLIQCNIL